MAAHCFDATTFVGPCNHKARGQHHNPPAPGRSHYLKIKRKQVCNKFFIGMKRIHTILIILLLAVTYGEAKKSSDDRQMDDFITSLMKKMTLEEKIGQLNLGGVGSPKVVGSAIGLDEAIRKGLVSSVGGFDAKAAEDAQKFAVENSRMKIPLITGLDVVHGYYTIFPIPLASACSWNMPLLEESARVAADEASAFGINWTFAPMVDICRDPRWGRIAEGAGEDPCLGSRIGRAMVRGFQGDDLSKPNTLLACVKHFALYGASEAGRDYNTVSMDPVTMYNYYLPPYKAAFDEGAGSGMTSFNVVNGVPATGNKWLLTDLLRDQWKFKGFMVSDANSLAEMSEHGMGGAQRITELAMNAGLDMDMSSSLYVLCLKKAVEEKRVPLSRIDAACRRVLEAKYKLGLFEDPFRYLKNKQRQSQVLSPQNRDVARRLAAESIVLLKNSEQLLPITPPRKIAVVGPMGNVRDELLGTWSYGYSKDKMHSAYEALREALAGKCEVSYSQGANYIEDYCIYNGKFSIPTDSLIRRAIAETSDADLIIATVGEPASWSGEAKSRVNPSLPDCQKKMLRELKKTGKPVVVVIFSGRPLILTEEDAEFSTLVEAWHGGTMAGEALCDILLGKVCPSGKITATFPRHIGQIPIYYNHLRTGRPYSGFWATTKYVDCVNEPLYPFGYGLSYNRYTYGKPVLDKKKARGDDDVVTLSIDITNTGKYTGKEVVQLYIGDPEASVSRPVIELKDFQKVDFAPGETKTVTFRITTEQLKFYNQDLKYDWEAGKFNISVGPNSRELQKLTMTWDK